MAPPSQPFGELLRRYRAAAGLTQEELAAHAGLTPHGISLLERGERRRPQAYTVHALADALELVDADRVHFAAAAKGRAAINGSRPTMHTTEEDEHTGPPFVGRRRELDFVQQHLGGDAPAVLMLAGEPGIGKSRLLEETTRRARIAGWTVLAAGCQRWGSEEPYAPLRAAVQEHIGALSPANRRTALAGCAWLVHLLPELGGGPIEPLPTWTAPPDQARRLMFEATARFLRHVAAPRGTLLVLDDLQWAGKDALDLLTALVQSPEAAVRVVGAYRDTEAPDDGPLATLLYDLARAGRVQHCALTPLSSAEAQELVGHLLPATMATNDAIRDRVVQRTGGVPFFVVSCAQALGLDQTTQRDRAAVPWDVAQSVRQRVADQTGRLPVNVAFTLIYLGYLSLAKGARDAASQYLEQAVTVSEPSGNMEALRWAHRALAERGALTRVVAHADTARSTDARKGAEQASLVSEELALPVVIGPGVVITPGVADDFEDEGPGHGAALVMRVSCDTRR